MHLGPQEACLMLAALPCSRSEGCKSFSHACRFCYMNPDELRNSCEAPEEVHVPLSMHAVPKLPSTSQLEGFLKACFISCRHTLAASDFVPSCAP